METGKQKKYIIPGWLWLTEVLIEPILWGFSVVILFSRLQIVLEASTGVSSFWDNLEADMNSHLGLYFGFLFVFLIWAGLKALRIRWEYRRYIGTSLRLEALIKANSDDIKALAENIKELVEEIRKDRVERYAGNSTMPSPPV